jgi:H+/gluconate symporter-like permease
MKNPYGGVFDLVTVIIAFIVGILASVVANILTPSVVNFYVKQSTQKAEKRVQKLESQLEKYRKYLKNPTVFIANIGKLFLYFFTQLVAIILLNILSVSYPIYKKLEYSIVTFGFRPS